ncbi:MAG: EcsC family protein [Smithellaceae bacterium]|nr:EcsC family protein [Syntrophaceae bacterium]MDD4241707.1 EcsC family protein [Smithellaceae bacterium]NLX51024.1 EcsC family protein [Deltaproteobacteria bacterium]
MTPEDLDDLLNAKLLLENPGLAARLTSVIGMPFEKAFAYLPEKWSKTVQEITRKSLGQALTVALRTMDSADRGRPKKSLHKWLAATSGGIGGAFGLPALAVELPVTTVIMLRAIADIARSEGENIRTVDTQLACLEVFALGGRSEGDNAAESGYYAIRTVLAQQVSEAAKYLLEKGLAEEGAPVLVRLFATVASRFGVTVSQKAAASAVPVIGAAGGALVNAIFMDHFQNMARGHFIIRRLERIYGDDAVRKAYAGL